MKNKFTPNIDIIFEEEPKSNNGKKVSKSCSPKREPVTLEVQNKLSSLLSNFLASDPSLLDNDEALMPNIDLMSPLDKVKSTNPIIHETQRPLQKIEKFSKMVSSNASNGLSKIISEEKEKQAYQSTINLEFEKYLHDFNLNEAENLPDWQIEEIGGIPGLQEKFRNSKKDKKLT